MSSKDSTDPQPAAFRLHLLDVGVEKYADAILIEFGPTRVLVDGAHTGDHDGSDGHPSIPEQLQKFLGDPVPVIDLLIVSHLHEDHIGCLPRLVSDGILRARWALVVHPDLGWPRGPVDAFDAEADSRVLQVVAGLREEPRLEELDGRSVDSFLADAAALEGRFRKMLDDLESANTRIVQFTGETDADVRDLLDAFAPIGLKLFGPDDEQMLFCADKLDAGLRDAVRAARDEFGGADAAADAAEVYARLAGGVVDSIDGSRLGNFVNLQSLVTAFEFRNRKLLLAGDMQFAKPGTNDPAIRDGVARLHAAIAEGAPYDFVKISHHGADNAFDENFLDALGGTKLFGICAGEKSTKHPHRAVLELLDRQPSSVRWPRTDRNGLTTITFSDSVRVKPSTGNVRDARPNSADEAIVSEAPERVTPPAAPPAAREVRTEFRPADSGFVEVSAKIPHTRTSVSITVDVAPGFSGGSKAMVAQDPSVASLGPIDIGSGRALPKLLVVTDRLRLADNIGAGEAAAVLDAVRAKGLALVDELPAGPATEAARVVHQRLKSEPGIEGVLLIGGYDVVPAHRLDTLPASLRAGVDEDDDPDEFIVWSDEIYASLDGDTVADLPISRIPDGRSSQFVRAALKASARPSGAGRAGVRNVRRPFADEIFRILPGGNRLLQSKPTAHDQSPPLVLDGDFVYLMLHGDSRDSTRFWGEGIAGEREAVNIRNLPPSSGPIVFTGCCWGALIADPPAVQASAGQIPVPKAPESSIALTFLGRGANAFVGCTGAHYSPDRPPFGFFGGPMHEAFWRACLEGKAPAVALHEAKRRYALDLPHGQGTTVGQAIESKILRQFTCLGLGF